MALVYRKIMHFMWPAFYLQGWMRIFVFSLFLGMIAASWWVGPVQDEAGCVEERFEVQVIK